MFYISVKVKWNKELFKDVEVNTDDDPLVFKAQLFALTGVQPERQKVMVKGMTLKDNEWGNLKLENVSDCLLFYCIPLLSHIKVKYIQ